MTIILFNVLEPKKLRIIGQKIKIDIVFLFSALKVPDEMT